MYSQVEQKLYVTEAAAAYSQAVSMAGANGVLVEATCFNYTISGGDSLRISVEESNDLQNWEDISGTAAERIDFTGIGYDTAQVGSIAAQYVRLKIEFWAAETPVTSGEAVVAAGIHTGNL